MPTPVRLLALGLALLLIAACTAGIAQTDVPRSTALPGNGASADAHAFPTPDPNATALECLWSADAFAWIDEDRDSQRDADEKPLEGVKLTVYFAGEAENAQPSYTNGAGHVNYDIMLWGCSQSTIEVEATPPNDYVATTPLRQRSAWPEKLDEQPFLFGFAPAK